MKNMRFLSAAAILAMTFALLNLLTDAQARSNPARPVQSQPALTAAPSGPPANAPQNRIAVNEIGQVMILEYHLIGKPEGEWRRTPENFRRDLDMLLQNGYYPVALQDYLANRMDVPAGKTPVVITFDDSSEGQFRYVKRNGRLVVDPDCAVGIMEQFTREHPEFPARATFFVLPAIDPKLRLFGQPEYVARKIRYLVKRGYEIGNHTYWHQNLAKASREEVQRQLALAEKAIQEFQPGYRLRSLALPFGAAPSDRSLLQTGEYEGHRYRINAALLVGSGPAPAPIHKAHDPMRLPRIQAGDHVFGPAFYVQYFAKHPERRYISDGSVAVISIPSHEVANLANPNLKGIAIVRLPDAKTPNAGGQ